MKEVRLYVGIAVFLMQSGVRVTEADVDVSFANDVVPIMKSHCAVCHLTGEEAGKLDLTPARAYASTVGVLSIESKYRRVEPGFPQESYLLMKLENTHLDHGGKGSRMPYGAEPLDPGDIAKVRSWIAQGAKNN